LRSVTSFGGQVEITPRDDIIADATGGFSQSEATQYGPEPDFDSDDFEAAAVEAIEKNISDSCEPLTIDIENLCIEYVAGQQNLVTMKHIRRRRTCTCHRVATEAQPDGGCLEGFHCVPVNKVSRAVHRPNDQPLDHFGAGVVTEPDGQVSNAPYRVPLGGEHVPASDATQQEHSLSLPDTPPAGNGLLPLISGL
jgi:hypothetical protein